MLEYGFHALREEKKARYIAFRDSLLQVEKQEEQTEQEKQQQQLQQQQQQQQQQQEKARQAEEELYYAQQQTELAASGRKASGKLPDYSGGMVPPTPNKKPYEDYNNKKGTGFFGRNKKGHEQY